MICTCDNHITINESKIDPTRTTVLRNSFAKNMNKRFSELERVVMMSVYTQDCFGLNLSVNQMNPTGKNAFSFARSPRKVEEFMKWLQEQVNKGILTVGEMQQIGEGLESAWTNLYIIDSYKRGLIRARVEMKNAGMNIPSVDETGGIAASMMPIHLDRLGLLYTRVFNELKGITDDMDKIISRILTQGMADGDNPRLLANKLVAAINGEKVGDLGLTDSLGRYIPPKRRAELLARTEIIRAHHQAMITEYQRWGVLGVQVKAEWWTAGDHRVCGRCAELQGTVYTLEEIFGKIPLHPLCRCIALPFVVK